MKIVIIGPPTSGKGTQSRLLKEKYNLSHISTGDIFRSILKDTNKKAEKVEYYITNSIMVPDNITVEIVKNYFLKNNITDRFILDGYPRTISQAKNLLKIFDIDYLIELKIEINSALERVKKRLVCNKCMNTSISTDEENICELCGGELLKRLDDKKDNIILRFKQYHTQTNKVIKFLKSKSRHIQINANLSSNTIFKEIKEIIEADNNDNKNKKRN